MSKNFKKLMLSILLVIMSVFTLAGCQIGITMDDIVDMYDIKARVTYFANGGMFESTPGKDQKEMYFKANSVAVNIGTEDVKVTSGSVSISRPEHEFIGWYFVNVTDGENPMPVGGNLGNAELTEAVDFSVRLQEGDHWYVAAKWQSKDKVNVYLSCDADASIAANGTTYQNESYVTKYAFESSGIVGQPDLEAGPLVTEGYTFLNYYYDKAGTQPVKWPLRQSGEGDVNIYAKYIKGEWDVLRSAEEVKKFFTTNLSTKKNYCLAEDIDCSAESSGTILGRNFAANFDGFGFTIKNLNLQKASIKNGGQISLFGTIQATAVMKNVTLENLTLTYKSQFSDENANITAYALCAGVTEGASFENVTFDIKMQVNIGEGRIENISKIGDTYQSDKWLCGGEYVTDAEFLAAYSGITVTDNSKFEINP